MARSNKGSKQQGPALETAGNLAMAPGAEVVNLKDAKAFKELDGLSEGLVSTYGLTARIGREILSGVITGEQVRKWENDRMAKAAKVTGDTPETTAELVKVAKQRIRNTIRALQNFIRTATKDRKPKEGGQVGFNLNEKGDAYSLQKKGHTRGKTGRAGGQKREDSDLTPEVVAEWCMTYLKDDERTPAEVAEFREHFRPVAKLLKLI